MRSLEEMSIIEIDITNACVHSCSNCTRFCGHHKNPYFMTFEQFKEAVDSLEGFQGRAGIMGGEPTLHPEFKRFCSYLQTKRGSGNVMGARGPIKDMQLHILSNVNVGFLHAETVLLSSLNTTYYKNFEVINDTFRYQLLNDHDNKVEHQALLMTRKELGISDEEWLKKRDACWIQNNWSGSITPKGAFFGEVAGALDMLFDGPGGWKVEPGWWKRKPEEFGEQLKWCEMCSGCLDAPKRISSEDIDDVTPEIYERLKALDSPKLKKGRVEVRNPEKFSEYSSPSYVNGSEYIVDKGENVRMSTDNKALFPKDIACISKEDIQRVLAEKEKKDWILITDDANDRLRSWAEGYIWNPGCLYVIDDSAYLFNSMASSICDRAEEIASVDSLMNNYTKDKIIRLSSKDPFISVMGGDADYMPEGMGSREGKRLLVYGAGMVGNMVTSILDSEGFRDFDVVVTDPDGNCQEISGHKVRAISEFADKSDEYVVLMAATPQIRKDMVFTLQELGFKNYRPVV